MTPADIDRVFGRGRLRMVTGDHVEVFREASLPGERRRYTKRFLATAAGDFREWTEREWRILARLVGHGVRAVPQVVQFDRGAADRPALVQTYDAGVTVDHWATLLPLERDGTRLRNVFEDCAHWWALARHCLVALDAIHSLQLVHLDLKADNVCIPIEPADFDPHAREQTLHPRFDDLALIDFAFSLVSGEPLESALPIAQQADYEYQSPRLLRALDAGRFGNLVPTRQLDWRCDLFSLAAMLWRYLPEFEDTTLGAWTRARHAKARALVRRLVEAHDAELPTARPHAEFIALASEALEHPELNESLQRGWRLTVDGHAAAFASPTPVTRIALPVVPATAAAAAASATATLAEAAAPAPVEARQAAAGVADVGVESVGAAPWFFGASANDPIRIDPTDVDARALLRERQQRRRSHTVGWAGGLALAAVAAASVPWLAPGWLVLPGVRGRDANVALAPTAATAAGRGNASRAAPPAAKKNVDPAERSAIGAPMTSPEPVTGAERASPTGPTADAERTAVAPTATGVAAPAPTPPVATASDKPASHGAELVPAERMPGHERPAAASPAARPQGSEAARNAEGAAQAPSPRPTTRGQALARAGARPAGNAAATRTAAVPAPTKMQLAQASRGVAPPASPAAAAATGARPRPQLALAPTGPAARLPASRTWQDPASPIPWAVAGKPAPRLAATTARVPPASVRVATAPATTVAANGIARVGTAQTTAASPAAAGATGATEAPPATSPGTTAAATSNAATVGSGPAISVAAAPREVAGGPSAFPASRTRDAAAAVPPVAGADAPADLVVRANDLMVHQVPRLAQQAERSVARVLFAAARSDHVLDDDEIRASAMAIARAPADPLAGLTLLPRDAQQLHDAARAEYARRGTTAEGLMLQVRAFGANPLDAEIAGNLAFLLLRQKPAQPEAARQLALHALTLRGPRNPEGRIEDWATFAIASALSGRERDARNALLVTLALAPNLDRHCKAALDVYGLYGERLRGPVETMLQTAHASARGRQASFCEWPPHWVVSGGR